MSSASTHICIVPSRYNFAYSSGSSMASAFNEQTDPGVVYKSFSASQQSIRSIWPALVYTSMLLRCGLYSANIVLIVTYLFLSLNQLFVTKIRSISISSPCHIYFVLYNFLALVFTLIRVRKFIWEDIT